MARNVIVELEPSETLAKSFTASLSLTPLGAVPPPTLDLPGFTLDVTYPPVPVPHPTAVRGEAAVAFDAMDVSERITFSTDPLQMPYCRSRNAGKRGGRRPTSQRKECPGRLRRPGD